MSQDNQILSHEVPKASRRAILTAASAAAAAAALAGGAGGISDAIAMPGTADVDPIFAVIAEHRTALEEYLRAVMVSGAMISHGPDKDPNYDSADNETRGASDWEQDALYDVLTTQPTSLAGVVALLAHVALPEFLREEPEFENETILSAWTNSTGKLKQASLDFPARLAETMRGLIERGQA
jgi:hypothetical protein